MWVQSEEEDEALADAACCTQNTCERKLVLVFDEGCRAKPGGRTAPLLGELDVLVAVHLAKKVCASNLARGRGSGVALMLSSSSAVEILRQNVVSLHDAKLHRPGHELKRRLDRRGAKTKVQCL